MFFCLWKKWSEILAYCDDSNGDIGGCFENALEILQDLSEEILPEEIRIMLFEYFIDAYKERHLLELGLASGCAVNFQHT
ncbi:MAG: hypothetical protein IPG02_16405 [Ignavibacteria bacterium]|nr:hypothetical protein [Ignavibacteria bacterium]